MRRRWTIGLAGLLAALAASASAQAAAPVVLGEGAVPAVVADDSGAAQVSWKSDGPDLAHHCVVPPGSTDGCATETSFSPAAGNGIFDRVLIARRGEQLVVLWRDCCAPDQVQAAISADSGASFAPQRTLAQNPGGGEDPGNPTGDAIIDAGNVYWPGGVTFQGASLAPAPPVGTRADLFGPVSFGSVAGFAAGQPLVVAESDAKTLSFRRYIGGDVNDEASYSAAKPITTAGAGFKRPALANEGETLAGDALHLAYTDDDPSGPSRPIVRTFDAVADEFGPARPVADQSADLIDIASDPTGLIHVAWRNSSGIHWASSDDGGESFSTPRTIHDNSDSPLTLQIAATGDGGGWVAYQALDGTVRVVEVEADTAVSDADMSFSKKITVKGREFKGKISAGAQEDVEAVATGTIVVKGAGSSAAAKKTELRPVSKEIEGGERKILRLKFEGGKKKRQKLTRKLKRTIKQGRKVRLRAQVEFTDEVGNSVTEKRVARLKVRKGR